MRAFLEEVDLQEGIINLAAEYANQHTEQVLVEQHEADCVMTIKGNCEEPYAGLGLVRGHWTVERRHHYPRDVTLGEDRSRVRTGHGPAWAASLTNLMLAIVWSGPRALRYYMMNRSKAPWENLRLG